MTQYSIVDPCAGLLFMTFTWHLSLITFGGKVWGGGGGGGISGETKEETNDI